MGTNTELRQHVPAREQGFEFINNSEHSSLRRALTAFAVLMGALAAYITRYSMGVDGISYVDIAHAYLRHDWPIAINGYWSPLYSWLLALVFELPHSGSSEFLLVHCVNLCCYLFALYGFVAFWNGLTSDPHQFCNERSASIPDLATAEWSCLGYVMFIYLFVQLVGAVSPDVLSAGFIFLGMNKALSWHREQHHTVFQCALFALVLALGYLAKAILLYFAFSVLVTLLIARKKRDLKPILITSVLFVAFLVPWLLALHHTFGEFTPGYSGRLAYSWFVNGTEAGAYLKPEGTNLPYFPGERLTSSPVLFHVKSVPNVTYWPWFDPSRIARNRTTGFNFIGQLRVLRENCVWLRSWFLIEFGAFTLCAVAVWIASGRLGLYRLRDVWFYWLPVFTVFGLYSLVFIRSFRYIAGFTIVAYGLCLAACVVNRAQQRMVRSLLAAAMMVFIALNFPGTIKGMAVQAGQGKAHFEVASALQRQGIRRGEIVAVLDGNEDYFYWARIANVSIGAEMWPKDSEKFWRESKQEQEETLCTIKKLGISRVVGHPPVLMRPPEWSQLGQTEFYSFNMSNEACDHLLLSR